MKQLPNKYIGMEVSNATMRAEDLIPSFMNFLINVAEECEIQKEVDKLDKEVDGFKLVEHPGYGEYYKDEDQEQISWILNESIWDLMQSIAPDYTYFGSQEGDGACYGFWTDDEALGEYVERQLDGLSYGDFDQVHVVLEQITETLNNHDR